MVQRSRSIDLLVSSPPCLVNLHKMASTRRANLSATSAFPCEMPLGNGHPDPAGVSFVLPSAVKDPQRDATVDRSRLGQSCEPASVISEKDEQR